ncbi:MAG: hypothetical protein JGK17_16280 [Microcoleus sp. PH2017_10_PVI_O_A]|uniref:hypothetical protein n=1 Tax=unclassified Microcoleus TaxID=2642155 RepID=UPI001D5A6540|nr:MULTISPECIES: hypothetical protein [unclassified Microcoleus]MCC3407118.1 hypothetical protein [Microcoleus sp. PH2017_10_PVI_O_A]MCC3461128.1 hypothetical protein [Microcoleus sp. PH2017_11_PCY_U_A]MCC3479644.1 hypothetical protein [Microcoleus sp. PH2017_12_PCY_D_A]MCC3531855.1 hypothetical protein [Microcoleus sp. PH2017_21_RUC_O_A]MCC3544188.1 hypothetical protein [Microcoleus sp. PH2017_22_RUC_O_B]
MISPILGLPGRGRYHRSTLLAGERASCQLSTVNCLLSTEKVIFNTSAVDSQFPTDREWCDR